MCNFLKLNMDLSVGQGKKEIDGGEYTIYSVTSYMAWENIFRTMMRAEYVVLTGLPDNDSYYYEVISFSDEI